MHTIAIDIGGTNTKIAIIAPDWEIVDCQSIPTAADPDLSEYLAEVVARVQRMIAGAGSIRVDGVGIGIAGFVDPAHRMMTFNPNIQGFVGYPLADFLSEALDLPVFIEVDSNTAALAESLLGDGRNSRRLLVLSIGTGLGGGMVVDGEILRISHECLGDLGHVIVEPGGEQCAVGCHGCAEAMVSASALVRYAEAILQDAPGSVLHSIPQSSEALSPKEIIDAAKAGDSAARRAVQRLATYLGIAMASMAPILYPDTILIAGGLSEAGSILLEPTQQSFLNIVGPDYGKEVRIAKAHYGWQAVLVGAAAAYRMCNQFIVS